jgi:hypothetical protein
MGTAESLSHTRWERKYHLVWIPKCWINSSFSMINDHRQMVR